MGGIFVPGKLKFVTIAAGAIGVIYLLVKYLGPLNRLGKEVEADFKHNVIKRIVHFIAPDLAYSAEAQISETEYDESGIFKTGVDRYKGDDLVDGTLGKTYLRFSEIHSEYYTKDKDGNKSWHTIFKGIFLIADFNKYFNGQTFVLHDASEKTFGRLGKFFQKMSFSRPDLITLENPVFEENFKIYGTDPIEARYLLSSSMMERILKFKQKANGKINLSFINSKVFVAISIKRDLLEMSFYKDLENYEKVKEYHDDLALAIGIVADLDLNTRIWTKD